MSSDRAVSFRHYRVSIISSSNNDLPPDVLYSGTPVQRYNDECGER